jgi:hypothetical protein
MIGTIQARVLATHVSRLLKAYPPIQSWIHAKAMVSFLLLLGGEGRDEGGRSPAGITQYRQSRRDDLTIARSFSCGYVNPKKPSVPTGRLNLADPDGPSSFAHATDDRSIRPYCTELKGKDIAGMAPIIGCAEKFDLPASAFALKLRRHKECRQHFGASTDHRQKAWKSISSTVRQYCCLARPHSGPLPQVRVLAIHVSRLLKASPPIQSRVYAKAMVGILLLLGGECRDEGGRSAAGQLKPLFPRQPSPIH